MNTILRAIHGSTYVFNGKGRKENIYVKKTRPQ